MTPHFGFARLLAGVAVLFLGLCPPVAEAASVLVDTHGMPLATAVLTVPQGSAELLFSYSVGTSQISIRGVGTSEALQVNPNLPNYTNVWSIRVFEQTTGTELFSTTEQRTFAQFSRWTVTAVGESGSLQADLFAGFWEEEELRIDVSRQTQNSAISVIVIAESTDLYPVDDSTSLFGSLSVVPDRDVAILSITPELVVPTNGDSSWFSVPASGDTNYFHRTFRLKLRKPPGSTVRNARVALMQGDAEVATVRNEGLASAVRMIDEETLEVRASFDSPSPASTHPPIGHDVRYSFDINVLLANGETSSASRQSAVQHALWRMPGSIPRYGVRDLGLDDWSSRGAYFWLQHNGQLVTRIDDISGEHARDIGHASHDTGTDIDMFHFFSFPGAQSGGHNYELLLADMWAAFAGNALSLNRVTSWVSETRAGLDRLLPLGSISRVYYATGSPCQQNILIGGAPMLIQLPNGWARALLERGSVQALGGQQLQTGLGGWVNSGNNKMHYNATHNSHVHLDLNEGAL